MKHIACIINQDAIGLEDMNNQPFVLLFLPTAPRAHAFFSTSLLCLLHLSSIYLPLLISKVHNKKKNHGTIEIRSLKQE